MTIEEAEKAVEEARFRLAGELVVAPGSPAYWEALDALIEAVRQAERERAQHDINRAYEEGHADGVDAATRDLQFSSGTHDRAGWMVADHNERWHREEAGE